MGWIDILGYLASLIILISLLMNSVKRLRWINLFGAILFAAYGFILNAIPVGLMNSGIVVINIYYLFHMYTKKDYFSLLTTKDATYFKHFMQAYEKDIKKFMQVDTDLSDEQFLKIFILRNTVPAGVVVAKQKNQNTLEILIDYVTPTYRDFKMGQFLYQNQKQYFVDQGYQRLISQPGAQTHQEYLKKMGFGETKIGKQVYFEKML
jgi:hypothetical protein